MCRRNTKSIDGPVLAALALMATPAVADTIFVASRAEGMILRRDETGSVRVYAEGVPLAGDMASDAQGNIYVSNTGTQNSVTRISVDGHVTRLASGIRGTTGLALDPLGRLYAVASDAGVVFRVWPDGLITEIVRSTSLIGAQGLGVDAAGELYVTSYHRDIVYRVDRDGRIFPTAFADGGLLDVVFDPQGRMVVSLYALGQVVRFEQNGGATVLLQGLVGANTLLALGDGSIVVAAYESDAVLRIGPAGGVELLMSDVEDPNGLLALPPSCSGADLAAEFGVLDVNDVLVFAYAFNGRTLVADLAPNGVGDGMIDVSDVIAFAQAFTRGCP